MAYPPIKRYHYAYLNFFIYDSKIIVRATTRCADGRETLKTNIKIIATSLALASSVSALAGMGGLSVQSHLGQPFSGSIVVTGDEAEALKSNRRVVVSGSGIRGTVVPQGNGNVVVRLRSSSPIREPMINFTVSAGRQSREYTAMLDPSNYVPTPAPRHVEKPVKKEKPRKQPKEETTSSSGSLKVGQRDFIERNGKVAAHQDEHVSQTAPAENKTTRQNQQNVERDNSSEVVRRPVREVRERSQNAAPVTTGAVNSVRKSGKGAVSTRRHRAQAGETLSSIAERYRPRNMSLQTASRALAIANPAVFKRGHVVQRPTTLYIPTAAQWHAYAQRAQASSTAPRRANTGAAPRAYTAPQVNEHVVDSAPVATPNNNPPVVPNTAPQTQTQPQTQPQQPQPQTQPAQPATPPAATTQPAKTAPAVASPVVPANNAVNPQNPQPATTGAVASPAAPAVVQAASLADAYTSKANGPSIPVVPPSKPAEAVSVPHVVDTAAEEEEMEGEGIDWALYGGGIGGALLVAGVAGYFLRKRRNESVEKEPTNDEGVNEDDFDDDDDDVSWEEDKPSLADRLKPAAKTVAAAGAGAAAVAATAHASSDDDDFDSDDDFEALPDDDDDVVFENTAPAMTEPLKAFDLNDFSPDDASLKADLVATTSAADADDDWNWKTPSYPDAPDTFESLDVPSEEDKLWSLDDGTTEPIPTDYSLDALDTGFGDFGMEEEEIQPASNSKTAIAEVDDIDAMFANALHNLDSLNSPATEMEMDSAEAASFGFDDDDELAAFERPKANKSVEAELDDIDAMFADKLAGLDSLADEPVVAGAAATAAAVPAFADDDDDELNQLLNKSLNSMSSPAAEMDDDLDALFTQKFGETSTADVLSAASESQDDDLDALFAAKFGDDLEDAPVVAQPEKDDLAALYDEELDGLAAINELNELDNLAMDSAADSFADFGVMDDHASSSPSPSAELDDIDVLFANKLGDLEEVPATAERELGELADVSVDDLMGLDALNALDDDNLVSAAELDALNALSEFDDLAVENTQSANEMEVLFANALTDIDVAEPVIKPILSEEDIENLNSLSELDSLEANEPNIDALFANALDDLDKAEELAMAADNLAFEAPVVADHGGLTDTAATAFNSDDVAADMDALAFDLSDFDALQNTGSTAFAEESALGDITPDEDALSFDLSGFDSLTDAVIEESLSDLNEEEMLAFATPEIPDMPVETPELSTPAVDFELPEVAAEDDLAELEHFASSLNDLETADSFADFDLPASDDDVGFVSGAVGSGDALETKLDLAKMYIEIEDHNAARAMLEELLAEADGEIAEKAQALMAQMA